jgi:DNA-binding CsgD family transcriptional regulator
LQPVQVGVVDEHEIFRRGLVACLAEDPLLTVAFEGPAGPAPDSLDVAVVSQRALSAESFACPLVVCSGAPVNRSHLAAGNQVLAVLPRGTLTPEQLVGAIRAAAAGLHVNENPLGAGAPDRLDPRRLEVLRLLAQGAGTLEISRSLRYSERTIKTMIREIETELGARNRAQAVAEGIRLGLI